MSKQQSTLLPAFSVSAFVLEQGIQTSCITILCLYVKRLKWLAYKVYFSTSIATSTHYTYNYSVTCCLQSDIFCISQEFYHVYLIAFDILCHFFPVKVTVGIFQLLPQMTFKRNHCCHVDCHGYLTNKSYCNVILHIVVCDL